MNDENTSELEKWQKNLLEYRLNFNQCVQIATFTCKKCQEEKTENWAIKQHPFYICNECKADLHESMD